MGGRALRTRRSPSLAVRAPACMPAPFSARDARLLQPPASPHSLRERPLPLMWESVCSPRPRQRDRGGVEGQVPTTECGAGGCCGEPRAGWQCGGRTRVRSCWRAACQRQPPRQRSQYASTDHAGPPWAGCGTYRPSPASPESRRPAAPAGASCVVEQAAEPAGAGRCEARPLKPRAATRSGLPRRTPHAAAAPACCGPGAASGNRRRRPSG